MSDDDDIEQAIRNAPEPPARPATDWHAIRCENDRRYTAALRAGKTYLNGRPRWLFQRLPATPPTTWRNAVHHYPILPEPVLDRLRSWAAVTTRPALAAYDGDSLTLVLAHVRDGRIIGWQITTPIRPAKAAEIAAQCNAESIHLRDPEPDEATN